MRLQAVVLGGLLTVATGAVANLAVSSAGFGRHTAPRRPVWYGGMIEPVTITAHPLPPPTLVTHVRSRDLPADSMQ